MAQFLVDQALHLQAEHYGDGMGLHLAMIKWARAANQSAPADKGQGEPVAVSSFKLISLPPSLTSHHAFDVLQDALARIGVKVVGAKP